MARRRGFLRALLGGIAAGIALPFFGARGDAAVPEISTAEGASTGVQEQDSSLVQAADSSAAVTPEERAIEIPLDRVEELGKVGGSKILKIDGRRILVVRDSEESVRSFQSECTHKNTTLKYDRKKRIIRCPAHGSRFDLEGRVIRGPAEHRLPTFKSNLSENHIVVILEEERSP